MDILGRKAQGQIQELVKKVDAQHTQIQELIHKDILTLDETTTNYRGNDYPDYSTAVTAIADKYNGKADWGCLQVGQIIDLRSAFILGEGLKVTHTTETKAEAEAELDFCKDFFTYNQLDSEMTQELVKEGEIEGKVALRLAYEAEPDGEPYRDRPGMVSARFVPWTSKRYTVEADANDYLWYTRLYWAETANTKAGSLKEPEFVYKKFGGRCDAPNEAQPKLQKCLTQVDRLDKGLYDLRKILHLFAAPTAYFKCTDGTQVDALLTKLAKLNWRIGKMVAGTADFSLVGIDPSGIPHLISEIELNLKMISGTTGIPIHFLGLLDLLKNRATGDNTRELTMMATSKERTIWRGAFQELIEKAMVMYNAKSGEGQKSTRLDPSRVKVEIPLMTQEHWDRIQNVLIPAALGGIISKEFVAGQIPGVDLEEEATRREEADASEMERMKGELEAARLSAAGQGNQEGEA